MGNVISVFHYGNGSTSAETPAGHSDPLTGESDESSAGNAEKESSIDGADEEGGVEPVDDTNDTSREDEMDAFRRELASKREARRRIIEDRTNEMKSLQSQLASERRTRESAVNENSMLRSLLAEHDIPVPATGMLMTEQNPSKSIVGDLQANMSEMEDALEVTKKQNTHLRLELSESHCSLQSANSDNATMNKEIFECRRQIQALKEMVLVSKKMLAIREDQLMQLKEKLMEIEKSFADRETQIMSDALKVEYEKQLQSIRNLRLLYEERARVAEVTRRSLTRQLHDQKLLTAIHIDKNQGLEKQIEDLQKEIQEKEEVIYSKDEQLGVCKTQTKGLQLEMMGINKLFTQMLMGHNQSQDLDKLVNRLEEHHDLLRDMAVKEDCSDAASALPKLLLEIVSQVENDDLSIEDDQESTGNNAPSSSCGVTSSQEIVGNLPKVWRVLLELLSHQNSPTDSSQEDEEKPSSCYKSVQTPSGMQLVPSVSRTYIRLKDLILEKKSVQKEMTKMKQLNSHLENRLQDQERRLCLVSSELTKTWHVVGRLRRHHQQLHTHEKILRYELKQKRKLLTEIKEQLEYCREKWDMARQKNSESEVQWQKLRKEFSDRKLKPNDDLANTSAESGFSDEKQSEDEDSHSLNNDKGGKVIIKRKKIIVDINPDSTTDQNPVAEGEEDPISDLVDVTDLPLDDQDNESEDISNANGDILSESEDQCESEDISLSEMGTQINSKEKQKEPPKSNKKIHGIEILNMSSSGEGGEGDTNIHFTSINHVAEDIGLKNVAFDQQAANPTASFSIPEIPSTKNISNSVSASTTLISPKQILENIRIQNEYLERRDQRMKNLEAGCNNLTKQVIQANNRGNKLTKRVDILSTKSKNSIGRTNLNSSVESIASEADPGEMESKELVIQPSSSNSENTQSKEKEKIGQMEIVISEILQIDHANQNDMQTALSSHENLIDAAEILLNVKKQNERLAERDRRFNHMEKEGNNIVSHINYANERGEDLCQESERIHNNYIEKNIKEEMPSCHSNKDETENDKPSEDFLQQQSKLVSTSNGIDEVENINITNSLNDGREALSQQLERIHNNYIEKYDAGTSSTLNKRESSPPQKVLTIMTSSEYEARLIAKEERLKRLEDQAKSLVDKCNSTKTKSVKIGYKLQELHNIYGMSDDQSSSNDASIAEEPIQGTSNTINDEKVVVGKDIENPKERDDQTYDE